MKRLLLPLFMILAVACGSSQNTPGSEQMPSLKVGQYNADSGPTPVGVIPVATLHDAQRNKDINLSIDYPALGTSYPVIVFSHAYGLSDASYEPLVSYWVSNGYVVIRPSHADAGALGEQTRESLQDIYQRQQQSATGQRSRRRPQPNEQQPQATPAPFRPNPMETIWDKEREAQWRNRVDDVKFIIDSLNDLEARFPELAGKMDHGKIGVAGHSYGAFTAMLIGGVQTFGNPPLQLADRRVKAILAMSPFGTAENRGLTAQSFATLRVPAMFMTGSQDRGAVESETPDWRKQAFEDSPAGDKYFVLIQGARSTSFTGGSASAFDTTNRNVTPGPQGQYPSYPGQYPTQVQPMPGGATSGFLSDRNVFQKIKITSLIFWDAYLKGLPSAHDLLTQDKMPSGVTIASK
jgi:predicted dienelactone hydrolase